MWPTLWFSGQIARGREVTPLPEKWSSKFIGRLLGPGEQDRIRLTAKPKVPLKKEKGKTMKCEEMK